MISGINLTLVLLKTLLPIKNEAVSGSLVGTISNTSSSKILQEVRHLSMDAFVDLL
jgi:hypothetical protein